MQISNSTQYYPSKTTHSDGIKNRLPVIVNAKTGQPFRLNKQRADSGLAVLQTQAEDDDRPAGFVRIFSTSIAADPLPSYPPQLPYSVQQYLQVANLGHNNRDNSQRLIDEKV